MAVVVLLLDLESLEIVVRFALRSGKEYFYVLEKEEWNMCVLSTLYLTENVYCKMPKRGSTE